MADPVVTPPVTADPGPAPPAARPEWLPEQFWDKGANTPNIEGLAKGYTALRTKMDSGKPADGLGITPPAAPQIPDDATPAKVLELAGLKADEVLQSWGKDGKLTEEQYAKLKTLNFSRGMVDTYLKMETQVVVDGGKRMRDEALKMVSGRTLATEEDRTAAEEQLLTVQQWALQNLPKEDLAWYNDQVSRPGTVTKGLEFLTNKYKNAVGAGGGRLLDGTGGSTGLSTTPFTTQADLARAMGDKRYAETLPNGMTNPDFDRNYYLATRERLRRTDTDRLTPMW